MGLAIRSKTTVVLVILGAILLVAGAVTIYARRKPASAVGKTSGWVEVERVRSGDTVIVRHSGKLMYQGVDAPAQGDPLFEEARALNEARVNGKKVRVRYETGAEHDKKGRLLAYVFVDEQLVNAELVRAGLAYARIGETVQRFSSDLLGAQAEARQTRRGLWALPEPRGESEYWADPKYGLFHRPSCPEKAKVKPERVVPLDSRASAFDHGWAPCSKCRP